MQRIKQSTDSESYIEVWQLDLSNYSSVKSFAMRCSRELHRLDCVIANAAIGSRSYSTSEDNESMVTVNVVSTFPSGYLAPASSSKNLDLTRYPTTPHLHCLGRSRHGGPPRKTSAKCFQRVERGQFANGDETPLWGYQTAGSPPDSRTCHPNGGDPNTQGVIVNCVNPGFCVSELARDPPTLLRPLIGLLHLVLARSTEMGSRAHVFGAIGPVATHGQYMSNCRVEQ